MPRTPQLLLNCLYSEAQVSEMKRVGKESFAFLWGVTKRRTSQKIASSSGFGPGACAAQALQLVLSHH